MSFNGSAFIQHIAEGLIRDFQFSQGAGTPGLIGVAKEHPARVQLERLMPGGVSVGSGIVVDSYGGISRQQDIVIYENICPVFTHNGASEATYYPVEGVIAVGEVKSTFGKGELQDAVIKSVSVKALRRRAEATDDGLGESTISFRNYCNGISFSATKDDQFNQDRNSLHQIYSFILCQRFLSSAQATIKNLSEECKKNGSELMPNFLVSLENGFIVAYNSKSNSIVRSMMEGDNLIYSENPIAGFAQLLYFLRLYVISGKTVDRKNFERYFYPIDGYPPKIPINAKVLL
jgi:hypothetical protein